MAEVLCAGGGSGWASGLGLDRRAASWNAGSAGASSASGTGLAWTTSIGTAAASGIAAAILEVASCGSRGNAARPRTAATDSLVDTETIALDRSVSTLAACDMLSLRTPPARGLSSIMGKTYGRTVMARAAPWIEKVGRQWSVVSGQW